MAVSGRVGRPRIVQIAWLRPPKPVDFWETLEPILERLGCRPALLGGLA